MGQLDAREVHGIEHGRNIMIAWVFTGLMNLLEVIWQDGSSTYHGFVDILSSQDIEWLRQFIQLRPTGAMSNLLLTQFLDHIRSRVEMLRYWTVVDDQDVLHEGIDELDDDNGVLVEDSDVPEDMNGIEV